MNSKAIIGIIVVVVLAGGVWYMQGTETPPVPAPVPAPTAQEPVSEQRNIVAQAPAPTGKVGDILASLSDEDAQETAAIQAGDADAETALSDGAAINDLSQTYDETAL